MIIFDRNGNKLEINALDCYSVIPQSLQNDLDSLNQSFVYDGCTLFLKAKDLELSIDVESQLKYHEKFFYKSSIYKQPLAKALGLKKGRNKPTVLDATGGFLKDSLLILSMGIDLDICERNPASALLICDAINKIDNFKGSFFYNSVSEIDTSSYDTVYYDPMYTEHSKKSLPNKNMQVFRELIQDRDQLVIAKTLKKNAKRLVIKRPPGAGELIKLPDIVFKSKAVRYDVYLNH